MHNFNGKAYATITADKRDKVNTFTINNKHCRAEIALFGAHLLSFIPKSDDIERIWLSQLACFDKSKPIRGGVPICWPWFADFYPTSEKNPSISFPAHGFVRNQDWQLIDINENESATTLLLAPIELGLFQFSSLFTVALEVIFAEQCTVKLITKNDSEEAIKFTAALHTYFKVSNINQTEIEGVAGSFIDKTQNSQEIQLSLPYTITSETDRIHLQNDIHHFNQLKLVSKTISYIEQSGHDSVVIWNPWIEKSQAMPDMQSTGYESMVCIEASVTKGVTVMPKAQHILSQIIS